VTCVMLSPSFKIAYRQKSKKVKKKNNTR
jgi:hypothetical protein